MGECSCRRADSVRRFNVGRVLALNHPPAWRYLPASLTSLMPFLVAIALKSSYPHTSALMKPRSKSLWMTPAAWGAAE